MTEYSWLSDYQRTWEETKMSEDLPQQSHESVLHLRPLLRKLILILDYSKSASKKDFKPSRHKLISQIADNFEDLFYSYNPLSTLQTIVSKEGKAYWATSKSQLLLPPEGEFSVQNSLDLSLKILEETGPHWSVEILIVLNSLSTCDPGDLWENLQMLHEKYIRVHVISTCAEFYPLKEITKQTGGKWREHWELFAKTGFPASSAALIPMAFSWASNMKSPCACHLELNDGFICPVCGCKVCKLPSECPVCKYVLVSAPHLTKASLSMAPLPPFVAGSGVCIGCDSPSNSKCPTCGTDYCNNCQEFLRGSLGKCIGCSIR